MLNIIEKLREKTTIFYSTHILDDVQRVSDRVVILNQGEMIAQGTIEDLHSAGRDVVYNISFEGDDRAARKKLNQIPWITRLTESTQNGALAWHISVSNPDRAKQELLPLVVGFQELTILTFGRRKRELEEVFMQIVSGENHES